MTTLSNEDIEQILESLKYSKLKFEEQPIGPAGYPTVEYKNERIESINTLMIKVKSLKS